MTLHLLNLTVSERLSLNPVDQHLNARVAVLALDEIELIF